MSFTHGGTCSNSGHVHHVKDTNEVVESQQRAHYLLVRLHDDVNTWANTFVHQFYTYITISNSRYSCSAHPVAVSMKDS